MGQTFKDLDSLQNDAWSCVGLVVYNKGRRLVMSVDGGAPVYETWIPD